MAFFRGIWYTGFKSHTLFCMCVPLQHLLNDPLVKWLFSRRDVLLCLIFSLHSFYWKCYVQNQSKQSYFPQNLPYKKLFLQRMNFKLSPHSLILHLLLYDIMFYGCFSKPINFNQSAKFLPLGVLKLYSKLKIAMNALYQVTLLESWGISILISEH